MSGEQKGNGAAGGRLPSWLLFTQLSGTCHYLLYSSSPFITKYFSSFICCFSCCCCCCLLCWHPTEFASERGTSRRTFQRRQPAYLQLFDCLTQRLTAGKKTKPSRRKSPYGKLCMLIIIFRKTTTRRTIITTPALLQLFFSLI